MINSVMMYHLPSCSLRRHPPLTLRYILAIGF